MNNYYKHNDFYRVYSYPVPLSLATAQGSVTKEEVGNGYGKAMSGLHP